MNAKISIVIPFYQRTAGLLRRAVTSALQQQCTARLKLVIVDDGSPVSARNELEDLLSVHTDKITLIEQKNAGCYPASNTALDKLDPDTDFVAFLDSDDEWTETHLSHATWVLEQGFDFYFSDFYQLGQHITAFQRARRITIDQHRRIHSTEPIYEFCGDMFNQILTGNILGTSTIVYSYKRFPNLRYREDFVHTGSEYIFWLNLALQSKKIAFSAMPECRYGAGVNIFSESAWGSAKYLSVRNDEIKYKKYVLRHMPLSNQQKAVTQEGIRQSRVNLIKGFIHNCLHNKGVGASLFLKYLLMDPMTLLPLFTVSGVLALEKLRIVRGNAVEK